MLAREVDAKRVLGDGEEGALSRTHPWGHVFLPVIDAKIHERRRFLSLDSLTPISSLILRFTGGPNDDSRQNVRTSPSFISYFNFQILGLIRDYFFI